MNVKQLKKSTTEPDKTKCVCVGGINHGKAYRGLIQTKESFLVQLSTTGWTLPVMIYQCKDTQG